MPVTVEQLREWMSDLVDRKEEIVICILVEADNQSVAVEITEFVCSQNRLTLVVTPGQIRQLHSIL